MRAVGGVFVVAATLAASLPGDSLNAEDSVGVAVGSIAYVRLGEDGRDIGEIYVTKPDGSDERRLTRSSNDDVDPVWSPNGRKIAYLSMTPEGVRNAFVVNGDGSGTRALTDYKAGSVESVAWSADARRIAFVRVVRDRTSDIYVKNAERRPQRITESRIRETAVTWSATGRLAFVRYPGNGPLLGQGEIWVMNPDGSGQRQLTRNRIRDDGPAWSPDGSKLAFLSTVPDRNALGFSKRAVFVMRPDGSGKRRLGPAIEDGSGDSFHSAEPPAWSPDGTRIAVADYTGLYVMNVMTGRVRKIPARYPRSPTWSPDGRKLAFQVHPALYVVNADGRGRRRIVPRPGLGEFALGSNFTPEWSSH